MGSPMRGSRTGFGLAPLSGFAASTQSRAEGDDVYLGLINIVIEAFRHFLGVCVRFSVSLSLSLLCLFAWQAFSMFVLSSAQHFFLLLTRVETIESWCVWMWLVVT